MSGGKPASQFQDASPPQKQQDPYLKPETWLTVRREARQAVRLGANWRKTLQMVAGPIWDLFHPRQ